MSKLPLVEGVKDYIEKDNISFCMPGHKGGKGFLGTKEGMDFFKAIISADLTEVDGVDNLHNPQGIIKEALSRLSEFYNTKKSYFLVNGSTSGNLAMIFSCFNEGDKIIVERNCHRSVFNGIILRKLNPIYIKNKINNKYNAPISIDVEHFLCLIRNNKDAKGIIITYPNYYGICTDLKVIIDEAKKCHMKVLVDSAHGAHFEACSELPEGALSMGADMVVMSSHKTLASFTQTAYLHIGKECNVNIDKVDFYVSSFLSTSPSYMLMSSMDYGRFFLEEYGQTAYRELIDRTNKYRYLINKLSWIHIIDDKDFINEGIKIDPTRFVINLKDGYSGHKLYGYLTKNKIQPEMSDNSNVVLIFSPFNSEEDLNALYSILSDCDYELLKDNVVRIRNIHIPNRELLPWQAMEMEKIKVSVEDSIGKICGNSSVPYPPGVPILNAVEIIDEASLNMIKYYLENNIVILGIEDKKMTVLKN